MNIPIKTQEEIELMHEGGQKLATVLDNIVKKTHEGVTGLEIERYAQELIREAGGKPSFPMFDKNYPYATCISIDDAIVHGLPSNKPFRIGQVVGIDIGMYCQGFHLDMATTVGIGHISAVAQKLLTATKQSLEKAIAVIKPGICLGLIGSTVQQYVERHGFLVIRQLTGHGIGRNLHEPPPIPNYGVPTNGPIIQDGMVLAIEPMVSQGGWEVVVDTADHWTVKIKDGSIGAHFEHTVAVMENGPLILTKI